jgi:hypothetical protein
LKTAPSSPKRIRRGQFGQRAATHAGGQVHYPLVSPNQPKLNRVDLILRLRAM